MKDMYTLLSRLSTCSVIRVEHTVEDNGICRYPPMCIVLDVALRLRVSVLG
jgi:hypothetical protein